MQTLIPHQRSPEAASADKAAVRTVYVAAAGRLGFAIYHALQSVLDMPNVSVAWLSDAAETHSDSLIVAAIDNCLIHRVEHLRAGPSAQILPVHVHAGEAVIGPGLARGRPGCLQCWRTRYYSGRNEAHRWVDGAVMKAEETPDPWLTPLSLAILGQITAGRVAAILKGGADQEQSGKVYYLNLHTLAGRNTRFLPDPACPHCGYRPPDGPERAQLELLPRPKPQIDGDRLRDVRDMSSNLFDSYVSPRAGIVGDVKQLWRMTNIAVATTYVPLTDYTKTSHLEPCSGFCDRYSVAHPVAVLEALERYASTRPRDRRFTVHDSVAALGDAAVDPREFGWYDESAYRANGSWLTRFHDKLEVDFVWGYSWRRQAPVLIPAQLVYYLEPSGDDPTYAIDSSVGCSMGSCLEEAILQGLLEVMERDAFLLHWYAQNTLPAFDVMECQDPEVRAHYRRLRSEGYEVVALDATTDFGIPAVIVVARHRGKVIPAASCIAAAHLRPERALRKTFRELLPGLRRYGREVREEKLEHAYRLLEDNGRVRTMQDHAFLYCLPEASPALDFLTETTRRTSLQDMQDAGREFCSPDLTQELRKIAGRVMATARDVLIVNQTAPELHAAGLYCCKVLVPGAVPMTWGHHLRRFEGLPRLDRALASGGTAGKRAPNPAPHAFP